MSNCHPFSQRPTSRQRGLSLVELMVAMAVGLVLVIALGAIFINSSTARRELNLSAEVVENGRYALDVLERELSQTGFYGALSQASGTTLTNVCEQNAAAWQGSLAIHARDTDTAPPPTCLATRKAGTAAIFTQRASTCLVGEAGCAAEVNSHAYLQVSDCGTEYSTTPFVLAAGGSGAGTFLLRTKACDSSVQTGKRRLVRRIYFIANNDTLSYQEIPLTGPITTTPLVEGIEDMQIEYAVDSTGDGSVDAYSTAPADWTQVIGIRVWLLARSSEPSRAASEQTTFNLGSKAVNVAAATTNFKRRVYSSYISFESPKSRRQS